MSRGNQTVLACVLACMTTSAASAFGPAIPEDRDGVEETGSGPDWAELTARSAALCRQDRQRWQACTDRSDSLEAQGVPASIAVRIALDEFGA